MKRKNFLEILISAVLGIFTWNRTSIAAESNRPDAGRSYEKKAIKEMFNSDGTNISEFDFTRFPFEHFQTDGMTALAELERLKSEGKRFPIVVGIDDDVDQIVSGWDNGIAPDAADILKKADALGPDFDIAAYRKKEHDQFVSAMKAEGNADGLEDEEYPSMESGKWPDQVDALNAPTVTSDILTGEPFKRIHIAIIPARSATDIPAYLAWGNWNSNPPAEVHVAMFRRWNAKYGAEIVGMTGDVLNFRVSRRPASKDEALALAREMYQYCADIVEQGTQDIETLAATLLVSDYWYFWWD